MTNSAAAVPHSAVPDIAASDAERRAAAWLCSAAAVRDRAEQMLSLAEQDRLAHFRYHRERLDGAADYLLETIRANYPSLAIPFHSRWRHFATGGRDRWAAFARALQAESSAEIARIRIDLAVTSVLLDAGAGPAWSYRESDGGVHVRSDGLAVASLDMFRAGAFSSDRQRPWRADAEGLAALTSATLAAAFQVTAENPLAGLEGRAALLRRLSAALAAAPDLFGDPAGRVPARPGYLLDHLLRGGANRTIEAGTILAAVLEGLGPIWPGRIHLGGRNLGDVWHHGAIQTSDATTGLVPFHKLSQWLTYSLIEPIEDAGVTVTGIDALTGLAEYRNGGFIVDAGLIAARDPLAPQRRFAVGDEFVVEWRALTVALLDRLAERIRRRLGLDGTVLPLARVLEGGTWAAGRRIAKAMRANGGPPFQIESDGTVF